MLLKSLLIWICIIPLAIINGILREQFFIPALGENYALPLSGIFLSILIFLLSYFTLPRIGTGKAKSYWLIGIIWLILTILFEFGFGLLVAEKPLTDLLQAYNIATGNLWLLVIIFTFFAPWLTAKLKKII